MKPMKDNPCFGCKPPKRTPTCHATCPDYIIASAFHEAEKAALAEENTITQYSVDTARKNREYARKRKKSFKGCSWRNC